MLSFDPQTLLEIYNLKVNLDRCLARTLSFSIKTVVLKSISFGNVILINSQFTNIYLSQTFYRSLHSNIYIIYHFRTKNVSFSLVSVINFKMIRVVSCLLLSISKQKMSKKNTNNSETEAASEKQSFAFERGPQETLKTHEKKNILFYSACFSNGSSENLVDLRMIE